MARNLLMPLGATRGELNPEIPRACPSISEEITRRIFKTSLAVVTPFAKTERWPRRNFRFLRFPRDSRRNNTAAQQRGTAAQQRCSPQPRRNGAASRKWPLAAAQRRASRGANKLLRDFFRGISWFVDLAHTGHRARAGQPFASFQGENDA